MDFIGETVRQAKKLHLHYQTDYPSAKLLKCVFKVMIRIVEFVALFCSNKKQESNFRNLELLNFFFVLASNPTFETLSQILCKPRKMQVGTFSFYFLISSLKIILPKNESFLIVDVIL